MTRQEQIVYAAKASEKGTGFGEVVKSPVSRGVNSAYGIGFIEGAVWADQTMLEKVCKWLDEEMEDFIEYFSEEEFPHVISSNYDYKKDFIEAFRKAMEQ